MVTEAEETCSTTNSEHFRSRPCPCPFGDYWVPPPPSGVSQSSSRSSSFSPLRDLAYLLDHRRHPILNVSAYAPAATWVTAEYSRHRREPHRRPRALPRFHGCKISPLLDHYRYPYQLRSHPSPSSLSRRPLCPPSSAVLVRLKLMSHSGLIAMGGWKEEAPRARCFSPR